MTKFSCFYMKMSQSFSVVWFEISNLLSTRLFIYKRAGFMMLSLYILRKNCQLARALEARVKTKMYFFCAKPWKRITITDANCTSYPITK